MVARQKKKKPPVNWKRRWAQLRRAIRTERFLASVDYGMSKELDPKKHRDIITGNKDRMYLCDKILYEMRYVTQRGTWR